MTMIPATHLELVELYANYAMCLDDGPLDDWPNLFTESGTYRLIPRENHDAGMPLATMALEGRGMLRDRIYGAQNTLFFAPYYQRHLIGAIHYQQDAADALSVQANYAVFRTKRDKPSELLSTGRYIDRVVRDEGRLRFAEKLSVFDNELILNSIIYPI